MQPPKKFYHLITALDLSNNKLKSLPEEFSNLTRLLNINLAVNEFPVVPEVLQRLPTLTTINASSNKIKEVCSKDYDSMQSLELLILKDNPLREDVKTFLKSIVRLRIEI